ncbi:unnamed protein product [Gongylonema pulchrum]|uniref:Uncharacterized protein n=1 Tax=Gongylonema pulchrum TaxID=637853 RepID=A0A183CWL6_9BILA|nr:unnamed protein product [Gongylonema pulchrum]
MVRNLLGGEGECSVCDGDSKLCLAWIILVLTRNWVFRNGPERKDFALATKIPHSYSVSCNSLPNGLYQLGDCEKDFIICVDGKSLLFCHPLR